MFALVSYERLASEELSKIQKVTLRGRPFMGGSIVIFFGIISSTSWSIAKIGVLSKSLRTKKDTKKAELFSHICSV